MVLSYDTRRLSQDVNSPLFWEFKYVFETIELNHSYFLNTDYCVYVGF